MSLIICHSAKGGVGTTFIAAQLALRIAKRGHSVTAIDFTYQDSLKLHFGLLPRQALPSLAQGSSQALAIADVELFHAYEERRKEGFCANVARHGLPVAKDRFLIVDVSANDRELFDALYPLADLHIAALLPDPASLASMTRLNGDTPITRMERTALVLNQLDDRRKLSRHSHRFVKELFADQLIGTIRRDEGVAEALAMFETLEKAAPHSVAPPDLELLTEAVLARCENRHHSAREGIETPHHAG